jgi:hypothetical protein
VVFTFNASSTDKQWAIAVCDGQGNPLPNQIVQNAGNAKGEAYLKGDKGLQLRIINGPLKIVADGKLKQSCALIIKN